MAVRLRLTRSGSKKRPFYRVVATNSDARRDGRPLEFLGYYNPMTNPAEVKLDMEKIQKYHDRGPYLGAGPFYRDTVLLPVRGGSQDRTAQLCRLQRNYFQNL